MGNGAADGSDEPDESESDQSDPSGQGSGPSAACEPNQERQLSRPCRGFPMPTPEEPRQRGPLEDEADDPEP